uniref:Uncharacterized protein n=1 Tax=Ananas comosus var. bracteatus TaxID=296719 RepID=A0A6V7QLC1_ANACO|nr:unnamed protein product [Ananas comosus var. bracteatus]
MASQSPTSVSSTPPFRPPNSLNPLANPPWPPPPPPPSMPTSQAPPLARRTMIVTGVSHGIGRAIAAHLASPGADIVLGYSSSPAQAELLAADDESGDGSGRQG